MQYPGDGLPDSNFAGYDDGVQPSGQTGFLEKSVNFRWMIVFGDEGDAHVAVERLEQREGFGIDLDVVLRSLTGFLNDRNGIGPGQGETEG